MGRRRYVMPWMPSELKILTSVTSEAEADLICGRLREAGIRTTTRRASGASLRWGALGACDVLVRHSDWQRAKTQLEADEEPFNEEELARLSEEAGREAAEGGAKD
jgi:hypothetical protein